MAPSRYSRIRRRKSGRCRFLITQNADGTNFLYDGVNAVQELTGGSPTANMLEGGVDQNYLRTDVGGSWNYLSDALGSTAALADAAGVVQTEYTYGPFGTTTASGLSLSNTAQYTGRENDATGLYYYRARYYNPQFGRFLSEDPIGFRGGINKYAYVGNSPLNYTDPLGQSPMGFGWDLMTADGPFDALDKLLNPDGGGGLGGRAPCNDACDRLKWDALNLGIDSLGFIPGERALSALGDPRAAKALYQFGANSLSALSNAMQGNTSGGFGSTSASLLYPLGLGLGGQLGKILPGIGDMYTLGSVALDLWKLQKDVRNCLQ